MAADTRDGIEGARPDRSHFRLGAVRGYREGENPARWRGHIENLLPPRTKLRKVVHHAALPYADVAGFMVDLRRDTSIGAKVLQFTILTAARTGEALNATWSEIDLRRAHGSSRATG